MRSASRNAALSGCVKVIPLASNCAFSPSFSRALSARWSITDCLNSRRTISCMSAGNRAIARRLASWQKLSQMWLVSAQ